MSPKLVVIAAVLAGLAVGYDARAQPVIQSFNFVCHVGEGPRLTGCTPVDPPQLDPRKIENLRLTMEATPACLLGPLEVGRTISRPMRFVDSDALLTPPRLGGGVIVNPDWAERPSSTLLAKAYPAQARPSRVQGHATLACKVSADGTARDCKVVEESPTGLGFGDAALKLAPQFRFKPQTRNCVPTDDGQIRVPLAFSPP